MSSGIVENALSSVDPAARAAMVQRAMQSTASEVTPKLLLQTLLLGGSAGAGLSGLRTLGKVLKRSQPIPATYTMPVQADIYPADNAKKKKKKESGRKTAKVPYFEDLSAGIAKPGDLLKYVATGGLGMFAGYEGAKRLTNAVSAVARRRQLANARSDFERSLQEISEEPEPVKKPVAGRRKVAADPLMEQLASNCTKLAVGELSIESLKSWLPYLALLSTGAGATLGYTATRDNSKRKALEYAERRVNTERERTNPTFTTARLIKQDTGSEPEDRDEEARREVEQLLSQDYPYL